jgi:hypothetical protein
MWQQTVLQGELVLLVGWCMHKAAATIQPAEA